MPDSQPVALVTGAGRDIGRAVASRLSREGYRVVLTARSRDQLEETAAACVGETLVLPADLTSADAVEGLIADAGFRPIYVGDLSQLDIVDNLLRLWFALVRGQGYGRRVAFKVLTEQDETA